MSSEFNGARMGKVEFHRQFVNSKFPARNQKGICQGNFFQQLVNAMDTQSGRVSRSCNLIKEKSTIYEPNCSTPPSLYIFESGKVSAQTHANEVYL